MLPKEAKDLAVVRMVQLVSVNELLPAMTPLLPLFLGLPAGDSEKIEPAKQKIATVLKLFENLLDDRPYFGSENITLAEAVAGSIIPWLPQAGVSLGEYPKLSAWCDRLISRPAWQATLPTPEAIEAFKPIFAARMGQQKAV
jgi:glutathione S-transferase